MIAITFWDVIDNRSEMLTYLREKVTRLLPQVRGLPLVFLSGLTGKGLDRLFPAIERIQIDWSARIKTPDLNEWLRQTVARHPPPADKGRPVKLKYITQTKTRPPTFVIKSSRADSVPESYKRYLVNTLRDDFDLPGIPIRIHLRSGANPYA